MLPTRMDFKSKVSLVAGLIINNHLPEKFGQIIENVEWIR